MIRVHVICEGQTEEMFVNELLAQHFYNLGIILLPSLIGKPGKKGGSVTYERLLIDLRARIDDATSFCTTFFDFYGLPENFPGKANAISKKTIEQKANCIQEELKLKIKSDISKNFLKRFIPYVQMYEFEGLIFSNPEKMSVGLCKPNLKQYFEKTRNEFATPEEINNSPNTAPSKRILRKIPEYEKPISGSLAAIEVGVDEIRAECKRFDQWLKEIEKLAE